VEEDGVLVDGAMRTMEESPSGKWTFFNVKCGHISARDQKAGKGVAISEGWHVHQRAMKYGHVFGHVEMEWIQTGSCLGGGEGHSDTTRWDGYMQEHTSGSDIVIQPNRDKRRHRKTYEWGTIGIGPVDASGKGSV
jgi:hypothetical protein